MIDARLIAAELEAEAQAAGFPRNYRVVEFLTAQGNPAMALVTVTVADPGITEVDDAASTPANTPVTIPVLANDVDNLGGGNANLRVTSVTQPVSGGSVAISGDQRSVIFTPTSNFVGIAQFTYTAVRV